MNCPHCGHSGSRVVDSRDSGNGIRRRRGCESCSGRYTTYEVIQSRMLQVEKRDGRREEFSSDKLYSSLTKACAKRPLPIGSVEKVVREIEADLSYMNKAEIPSRSVGEMVMGKLKGLDRVAYIRYASVYRDFQDIEKFKEEIDALLDPADLVEQSANQLSFLEEDVIPPLRNRRRHRQGRQRKPGSQSELPG